MNFWKSLSGMMEVELTSAATEQILNEIRERDIVIYHFYSISDLCSRFLVQQKDYTELKQIAEKRGEKLRLIQKKGIYWKLGTIFKRPVFCIGILLLLLFSWTIPKFVFFVEVTGNERIPKKQIMEAGEKCGIFFGARREAVRSEKVKNALLSELPQLQWAGVNTRGCVAVISVRERAPEERILQKHEVSSIVAQRDGIILSCTAAKGNLLCSEGQAVRSGQVLISGYTDCGLSIQATSAQGEIYALTNRELQVISPSKWQYTMTAEKEIRAISLLLGKKRINLWKDSGIWNSTCGRMYKEYYMALPGGFRLPVALCIDIGCNRELFEDTLAANVLDLPGFAKSYLCDKMIAGKILRSEETVKKTDQLYVLDGQYICTEMIGRIQPEKIGE